MLPPLDRDGNLANLADWNENIAHTLAESEGIELCAEHWEVLEVLRAFHARFELSPDNRALVKAVRTALGEEKGRSIHLMRLSEVRLRRRVHGSRVCRAPPTPLSRPR